MLHHSDAATQNTVANCARPTRAVPVFSKIYFSGTFTLKIVFLPYKYNLKIDGNLH